MKTLRRLVVLVGCLGLGGHWMLAFAPETEPDPQAHWIRIGLRLQATRLEVSCPAGLVLQDASGATVLQAVEGVCVERGAPTSSDHAGSAWAGYDVVVKGAAPARSLSLAAGVVKVRPADPELPLETPFGKYRGALVLEPDRRGRFTIVNSIPLESYLRGVVPAEMPPQAPLDALKAQAVVARTYAVRSQGRHAAQGFDLCASVHCQAYGGAGREQEASDRAVLETRGQVLHHGGRPINAYFHSTCGGATDSPAELWGMRDAPSYLSSVPDTAEPLAQGLASEPGILALAAASRQVFCGDSRAFAWEFERSREDLERTLARTLPAMGRRAPLGTLEGLLIASRTAAGRATTLVIQGSRNTHVLHGDGIRWVFGTGRPDERGLLSARVVIRPDPAEGEADGPPARYRFTGFGWGHGIGFCQMGAIGMARRGYGATRILLHYFPGAEVTSLEALSP